MTQPLTPLAETTTAPLGTVDLAVGGMTCASCVARVEKKLGKLDGVQATVNLATESAHVVLTKEVSDDELVAAVARAGYTAQVTSRQEAAETDLGHGRQPHLACRRRPPRLRRHPHHHRLLLQHCPGLGVSSRPGSGRALQRSLDRHGATHRRLADRSGR